MLLSSPAFDDGGHIPTRFGYGEQNVNPPLEIENVPEDAESLALVVDDPDAEPVTGRIWDHWVVWNVPPDTEEIPEDWDAERAGAAEGENDYGDHGYGGPNPPEETHEYRFELYAVDTEFNLASDTTAAELRSVLTDHVVEKTTAWGHYEPAG